MQKQAVNSTPFVDDVSARLVVAEPIEKLPRLSKTALKRRKKVIAQHNAELRKKAKEAGLTLGHDDCDGSSYYFENGLRKVYPYHWVIVDIAKAKWVGRPLRNILETEFEYYKQVNLDKALQDCTIHVNGAQPSLDHVVEESDYISQLIHRHENPVKDCPIEILADTDEVVVVNKPSSIPVHSCGWYRCNSLAFILEKEMGYSNIHNIYRIDRLASGVLVFGKTDEATKRLSEQVMNKQVEKEYVCRVVGEFPDDTITVNQPLLALSNKLCLTVVDPKGRPSQTTFNRLSYNGRSSVVRCVIQSGRTHQIRVHLQFLGHPIINDAFYNSSAWGPNKGKGAVYEVPNDIVCGLILDRHCPKYTENALFREKLKEMETLKRSKTTKQADFSQSVKQGKGKKRSKDSNGNAKFMDSSSLTSTKTRPDFDWTKWQVDPSCDLCQKVDNPRPRDQVLFLHALKYKGPDWEYQTELPDWAHQNWQDEDHYMLEEIPEEALKDGGRTVNTSDS